MRDEQPIDCARFDEAAWLLLSRELEPDSRPAWERHIAACDACAALLAERRRVLDVYDGLVPNPDREWDTRPLLAPARRAGSWPRHVMAVAASLILLVAGALIGRTVLPGEDRNRVVGVEERLADLEGQLAVARLQQSTAAERLKATVAVGPLVDRDPRVLASLLDALETDSSPNVRMAAIDAVYHTVNTAAVERRFAALLAAQVSPAIQIALIELAADRRLTETLHQLGRVAAESRDPAVQDRARWAIGALSGRV